MANTKTKPKSSIHNTTFPHKNIDFDILVQPHLEDLGNNSDILEGYLPYKVLLMGLNYIRWITQQYKRALGILTIAPFLPRWGRRKVLVV